MVERVLYPRMAMALLALIGAFNASYLLITRYQTDMAMLCLTGNGCSVVQESAWSTVPPSFVSSVNVPVALIGIFGYGLFLLLALAGLQTDHVRGMALPPVLVAFTTLGFAFSVYLVNVQAFVIGAFCSWCLLSALIMTTIWLLSIYDWRMWRGAISGNEAQALTGAGATPRVH